MSNQILVNIICGPLGSGKTSLVRNLLKQKPKAEQWALLVNEFGAIGIDGAILSETGNVLVKQMPGGCICCTAQSDLFKAVNQLLKSHHPDRLIIEPTGLGEPDTLVDLFNTPELKAHFKVQSVISVLDTAQTDIKELKQLTIMQSLLSMADILVLNKQDLATPQQQIELKTYCETLYPPKNIILETQNGHLDLALLNQNHKFKPLFKFSPQPLDTKVVQLSHQTHQHEAISTTLPYQPTINLTGLEQRLYKKQLGIESIGWIFNAETTFEWTKILALFQQFLADHNSEQPHLVLRAKGVFKIGKPWMLFQYAPDQVSREYIAYRQDSRLELLIQDLEPSFNYLAFEQALQACQKSA